MLQKSDRDASQLAPSVPLLSYRTATGCTGLKGSRRRVVRYRTKVLLSNQTSPQLFILDQLPRVLTFTLSSVWLDLSLFLSFSFFPSPILPYLSVSFTAHLSVSLKELLI